MKSRGLCALGCSAFRDSDRFTVTRSVQKGRGISLSWRDLRVISPSYQFATDTYYLLRSTLDYRSEEHTSELQSRLHLVCRLLLEKKKKTSLPWLSVHPSLGLHVLLLLVENLENLVTEFVLFNYGLIISYIPYLILRCKSGRRQPV